MINRNGIEKVIEGGYCIGCGICAALDTSIRMERDKMGRIVAVVPKSHTPSIEAEFSCPFTDGNLNEDEIASQLFQRQDAAYNLFTGFYISSFAGWVEEGRYRRNGSSGGMANWLLCELLQRNLIDSVIHVAELPPQSDMLNASPLFGFRVSTTIQEVQAQSKSRYYPVEMSGVIRYMLEKPGRYAVIGLPCFCKALRLAGRQSPILLSRLAFVIGIVCGHLKSSAFAELLALQCGVEPEEIHAIDFRTKLDNRSAANYGLTVEGISAGQLIKCTRPMEGLLGSNWGHGFFKYKACEFCDDVLAETADIAFGDAWLPEYEADSRGTNVIIVRNSRLLELLDKASLAGRLHLESISVERVVESQAGGLRHRREGLAYRLWLQDRAGHWRPNKRVKASSKHLSRKQRRIYRLRYELGQASHDAFAEAKKRGGLGYFVQSMAPLVHHYDNQYRSFFVLRLFKKIRRLMSIKNKI